MPIAHKHIKYVQQPAKQSAPHNVFVRNTQTLLNRWTGHAYYAISFAFFSICLFFSFNRYSVLLCLQILCAFFSLFFMNHCIFFFGRVMCVYLWNSSNIFYMYVNEYMRFFFASFSSNILPCLVILYTMILLCFFCEFSQPTTIVPVVFIGFYRRATVYFNVSYQTNLSYWYNVHAVIIIFI